MNVTVVVAAITTVPATIAAVGGILVAIRRDREKSNTQHAETQAQIAAIAAAISTNHGKRPGEYLELTAETLAEVKSLRKDFARHESLPAQRAHAAN
jgi:fructose/tagatose bisphosphate aldolase